MARPNSTGLTNRVQVEAAPAAPGVGVYAPLDVRAAPPSSALAFASLAQALGAAGEIGTAIKKKNDPLIKEQGRADEQLDKVDAEREKRSDAYAEGVYEARVIGEYNEAERRLVERATEELDRSLPYADQVKQLDAWFKEELGDFAVDDPKARLLIGERYTKFLEDTAGKILTNQIQDQTEQTIAARTADLAKNPTTENFTATFDGLYAVLGNRRDALVASMGAVTNAALKTATEAPLETAEADVEAVFAAIPAQVTMPDGTIKDGPLSAPEHAEAMAVARKQIADVIGDRRRAAAAEKYWDVRLGFEKKNEGGVPIRESEVKYWVDQGVLTDDQGLSILQENWNAIKVRAEKAALANVFAAGGDWKSIVGLEVGGSRITKAKMQGQFNDYVSAYAPTVKDAEGNESRDVVGFALRESGRHGLPYEPLKTHLSTVQGNPEAAVALLDDYQRVKAAGLAGMYVSEEAQAIYEQALDLQRAGTKPERVADGLARFDPTQFREHARVAMPVVSKGVNDVVVDDAGSNVTVGDLANQGYARARIEAASRVHVRRGRSGEAALETGAARVKETHGVVRLKGGNYLVPREPGVDLSQVNEALSNFEETILPQYAAKNGLPVDEVSFEVMPGVAGRGTELWVVDVNGDPLNEAPLSISALTAARSKELDRSSHRAAQAAREELQRVNAEAEERRQAVRAWAESQRKPKPYTNPHEARTR